MKDQSFLIMGVCGSGKSTIARMLADELSAIFIEGDDFQPLSNREKMRRGIPLTDDDRKPWLISLTEKIQQLSPAPFVLSCSALKEAYRQTLLAACPDMRIVLLHGSRELLLERMEQRENHFMPTLLLDSQLDLLEIPASALTLDIALTPTEMLTKINGHFSQ